MNVLGSGGGRTGPYWRRQMGTTLPGERTGPQIQLINRLRRKQGLPPLGGMEGEETRHIVPPHAGVIDRRRTAMPSPDAGSPFDEFPEQPGVQPMPTPALGLPAIENPDDVGGIRERLLRQFQGSAPLQHSREALRHFVAQQQQRRAMPGRARPILPPRQPMRGARPARPY